MRTINGYVNKVTEPSEESAKRATEYWSLVDRPATNATELVAFNYLKYLRIHKFIQIIGPKVFSYEVNQYLWSSERVLRHPWPIDDTLKAQHSVNGFA